MTGTAANPIKIIEKRLAYAFSLLAGFVLLFFPVCGLDRDRTIFQFHHTAWTAKDGAPSQVSALTQTEDGYLWIGSALGLFRFDGVTFEQYEAPDGARLPSNNIYALMATPDGGMWISFRPSGLGFLKDGKLKIYSRPEELPKSPVYCFGRTADGRIWAGTNDGLWFFNGERWENVGADWDFQPGKVTAMFTDSAGTLWVSKLDSIVFLPPGASAFQIAEKPGEEENYANQFAEAKDGRIWAARGNAEVSPVKNSGQAGENPVLNIGSFGLLFDRDGSLWVASSYTVNRISFPERLGSVKLQVKPETVCQALRLRKFSRTVKEISGSAR